MNLFTDISLLENLKNFKIRGSHEHGSADDARCAERINGAID